MDKTQEDEIIEILTRRANEVATFRDDLERRTGTTFHSLPGSVEMALSREVERLRRLAAEMKGLGI